MAQANMTTGNKIKLILALVGLALVVALILANMKMVEVWFLIGSVTMPLALLLIITLLIGIAVGTLGAWVYAGRTRKS